jgi:hypothetical protein
MQTKKKKKKEEGKSATGLGLKECEKKGFVQSFFLQGSKELERREKGGCLYRGKWHTQREIETERKKSKEQSKRQRTKSRRTCLFVCIGCYGCPWGGGGLMTV